MINNPTLGQVSELTILLELKNISMSIKIESMLRHLVSGRIDFV